MTGTDPCEDPRPIQVVLLAPPAAEAACVSRLAALRARSPRPPGARTNDPSTAFERQLLTPAGLPRPICVRRVVDARGLITGLDNALVGAEALVFLVDAWPGGAEQGARAWGDLLGALCARGDDTCLSVLVAHSSTALAPVGEGGAPGLAGVAAPQVTHDGATQSGREAWNVASATPPAPPPPIRPDSGRSVWPMHHPSKPARLLADVGQACLAADHPAALARRVLSTLTLNLAGVAGWMGLPTSDGALRVYDAMGLCPDATALADSARALTLGIPDGASCPVGAEASALLPGMGAGGDGLCVSFAAADGVRGWLLLVGPPGHGLAEGAEAVVATTGLLLGLALARLSALERHKLARISLPERALASSDSRRHGSEGSATLVGSALAEPERRPFDEERAEGLHQLAAGLAHALNNPLGAALANLDYVIEGLARLELARPSDPQSEEREIARAAADARAELRRLAHSVTARLQHAVVARRDAVRSAVDRSARQAVARFLQACPGSSPPVVRELEPLSCGVPVAECARWILRVLLLLHADAQEPRSLTLVRTELGPCVRVWATGAGSGPTSELTALARELSPAGVRLRVGRTKGRMSIEIVLPPALGESQVAAMPALEPSR